MDALDKLPVDDTAANEEQLETIQKYFDSASTLKRKNGKSVWAELLVVLFATGLFFLLSIGFVDRLIAMLPYMGNDWIRLSFKALIFAVLLYVIIVFTC